VASSDSTRNGLKNLLGTTLFTSRFVSSGLGQFSPSPQRTEQDRGQRKNKATYDGHQHFANPKKGHTQAKGQDAVYRCQCPEVIPISPPHVELDLMHKGPIPTNSSPEEKRIRRQPIPQNSRGKHQNTRHPGDNRKYSPKTIVRPEGPWINYNIRKGKQVHG